MVVGFTSVQSVYFNIKVVSSITAHSEVLSIQHYVIRRVWRYQRGNQNLYIEEEQTTQWPKEKEQKDKLWSTRHTHKTKDRVTWSPLKIGGEHRCSGRVSRSCSTSDTCRVTLVTTPVISHERGKVLEVFTTNFWYSITVGDFLWILRFPALIKYTILLIYCWKWRYTL